MTNFHKLAKSVCYLPFILLLSNSIANSATAKLDPKSCNIISKYTIHLDDISTKGSNSIAGIRKYTIKTSRIISSLIGHEPDSIVKGTMGTYFGWKNPKLLLRNFETTGTDGNLLYVPYIEMDDTFFGVEGISLGLFKILFKENIVGKRRVELANRPNTYGTGLDLWLCGKYFVEAVFDNETKKLAQPIVLTLIPNYKE